MVYSKDSSVKLAPFAKVSLAEIEKIFCAIMELWGCSVTAIGEFELTFTDGVKIIGHAKKDFEDQYFPASSIQSFYCKMYLGGALAGRAVCVNVNNKGMLKKISFRCEVENKNMLYETMNYIEAFLIALFKVKNQRLWSHIEVFFTNNKFLSDLVLVFITAIVSAVVACLFSRF